MISRLAPAWHRAYVRSHPLGLCVSFFIAVAGLIGLVAPQLVNESAAALVLPGWQLTVFNTTWLVGGSLATIGLLRGLPNAEAPGLALIAGGLTAYYIAVVSIRASSALTALFIAGLAIGCIARAWRIYRCGYDGVPR